MRKSSKIMPLNKALEDAINEFGLLQKIKEKEIFVRWQELVGKAIANNAKPVRIDSGKLWIAVSNAAWRHELSLRRIELKIRINSALRYDVIEEIILR